MSSSKMLHTIQILIVVEAVGAIVIGAFKLFTPRVSNEANTPLKPENETLCAQEKLNYNTCLQILRKLSPIIFFTSCLE